MFFQCWEKGIPLCKELAELYERRLFDYAKLSQILRTQAKFFDNILTQLRPEPEYFRVGFYGLSFPLFVRVRCSFMFCKAFKTVFYVVVGFLRMFCFFRAFPNDYLMTHRINCLCTEAWSMSELVHSLSGCRQSFHQHKSLWRTRHQMTPSSIQRDSVSFFTSDSTFYPFIIGL